MYQKKESWKIAIAPMLDLTDVHFRYLARILNPNIRLYTEMVVYNTLIYGNQDRYLNFNTIEHPIAFQIGGSDPQELSKCATLIEKAGYDEINLNCGCPSSKVQIGMIGACLMKDASLVASCLNAMQDKVKIPVTIKLRIGIDDLDSYDFIHDFIGFLANNTNCNIFIIHARKAILKGLSPKQNRNIPPLNYNYVYKLKRDFSNLTIIINGGIKTNDEIFHHLEEVDGVMIGREAYYNPMIIASWNKFFNDKDLVDVNMDELIISLFNYAHDTLSKNKYIKISDITRHYFGLLHGKRGAKLWRQILSNHLLLRENNPKIILDAWEKIKKIQ